jgi:hypothetical protein
MQASSNLRDPRAVLGAVKARPGNAGARRKPTRRPALTAPARDAIDVLRAATKERLGSNKGTARYEEQAMT